MMALLHMLRAILIALQTAFIHGQNYGGVVVRLPPGYLLQYPTKIRYPSVGPNPSNSWRNFHKVYPDLRSNAILSSSNDILNASNANPDSGNWDHHLDPHICTTLVGLNSAQKRLCSKYSDVTAAAAIGLLLAVRECRRQFADHRWNCTSLLLHSRNPHMAPIMHRGFRESAFGHAITAAGVTHSVSRACAAGRLAACSCGELKGRNAWKWSGCHDNTKFGAIFSRRFLDVRETARDIISFTHLYNNEVGRKVVRRNRNVQCKCHGMSGSCEMRTCWKAAPDFQRVGQMLVKKFLRAKPAAVAVFGNAANYAKRFRPVKREISISSPLLYAERSPTFCDGDPKLGISGVKGRPCNKTSMGLDSCHSLCCGRGYNIHRKKVVRKCHCRFQWCCNVTCRDCISDDWVTTCK